MRDILMWFGYLARVPVGPETVAFSKTLRRDVWGSVGNKSGCAVSRYDSKRRWMALSKDDLYLVPADKE